MGSSAPTSLLLLLILSAAAACAAAASSDSTIALPTGANHLHFYFHEKVTGTPNNTSVFAVDNHGFSSLKVYDNALRRTANLDSPVIGRAQGIGAMSDLGLADGGPTGGLTLMNLVFTADQLNGSTLALMGLFRPVGVSDRSIIGGSGRFRMARGYALSSLVSRPGATTTIVEFDVYFTVGGGRRTSFEF